jgi:uncharacterized membrane protein
MKLSAFVVAVVTFLSVLGASLLGLFSKRRLPSEHLQDNTSSLVRLVANLFVVMTSLAPDDEFGQEHPRNQQPQHSYVGD